MMLMRRFLPAERRAVDDATPQLYLMPRRATLDMIFHHFRIAAYFRIADYYYVAAMMPPLRR